jgi:predicted NAD-dependent protein-ADP-ribosyltransferase YbiA (DUF1768 family)
MENGYKDKALAILKIRSPKTIKAVVSRIPGEVKDIAIVWKDIYSAYASQNELMLDKLLNTKDDTLVFTNEIPYLGGVGIASEDTKLWKYPNIVGNALMSVRSDSNESKRVVAGGFIASTEKEIDAKRKGAIIHAHAKRSLKGVRF